jgi:hypothetical protein
LRDSGQIKLVFAEPAREWSLVQVGMHCGADEWMTFGLLVVETSVLESLVDKIHRTSAYIVPACRPMVSFDRNKCERREADDADEWVDWYAHGISVKAPVWRDAGLESGSLDWDAIIQYRPVMDAWRPGSFAVPK